MVLIYTDPQGKGLCSRPVTSRLNPLKSRILLKKSKKTSNKTKKDTTGQPCLFITLGYLSFCEETRYSVSENETDIPWKHPLALFHLISSSFSSPHACVQPLHQQFLFFSSLRKYFLTCLSFLSVTDSGLRVFLKPHLRDQSYWLLKKLLPCLFYLVYSSSDILWYISITNILFSNKIISLRTLH